MHRLGFWTRALLFTSQANYHYTTDPAILAQQQLEVSPCCIVACSISRRPRFMLFEVTNVLYLRKSKVSPSMSPPIKRQSNWCLHLSQVVVESGQRKTEDLLLLSKWFTLAVQCGEFSFSSAKPCWGVPIVYHPWWLLRVLVILGGGGRVAAAIFALHNLLKVGVC